MSPAAAAAGMAIVGGVLLIATGWRRQPRRSWQAYWANLPSEHVVAAGIAAALVLGVTRWVAAAAGAGAAAWLLVGWWQSRSRTSPEKRAEAIATWIEMLRDTAGTGSGLEGVLVVTASTAPAPVRDEVTRMARRLQDNVPLDQVLEEGADDMDHAVADLAITALRLSATTGGGNLREVLDDVAAIAHGEADLHRRLEVSRARPRAQLRYVALAIAGSITLLTVFAADYLSPYRSGQGQLILGAIGAAWVGAFVWMERLGRIHTIGRVLERRGPEP